MGGYSGMSNQIKSRSHKLIDDIKLKLELECDYLTQIDLLDNYFLVDNKEQFIKERRADYYNKLIKELTLREVM